ncbi:hypothetical protein KAFR_0I00140 [Kazachstania africana CBS 2517]|uniref:Uncharacterized protein n=1 Tax=Kazachstania africana (strain ATCC 22294 / BCRC 22015 / CBS 2517 / CECT 1963 / NBRC 1671 / NRRL Y-8276) TaxID=1071382 RepID=H2AZJ5_KAZAF|nr:hypothetical protein KAFR_0I00140 [Kazachstania africana CBS 2517]CCF59795.1 hypothetical protein KAFR_0I00140 [Kazachstania africana CBS 2517]
MNLIIIILYSYLFLGVSNGNFPEYSFTIVDQLNAETLSQEHIHDYDYSYSRNFTYKPYWPCNCQLLKSTGIAIKMREFDNTIGVIKKLFEVLYKLATKRLDGFNFDCYTTNIWSIRNQWQTSITGYTTFDTCANLPNEKDIICAIDNYVLKELNTNEQEYLCIHFDSNDGWFVEVKMRNVNYALFENYRSIHGYKCVPDDKIYYIYEKTAPFAGATMK